VDVVSRGDQPTWAGGSGRHATVCNVSRSHNSFIDPWPGLEGGVATTVVLRLPHAQSIRSIRYGVVTQHCRGFPTKDAERVRAPPRKKRGMRLERRALLVDDPTGGRAEAGNG
jgi:hypothetical protein